MRKNNPFIINFSMPEGEEGGSAAENDENQTEDLDKNESEDSQTSSEDPLEVLLTELESLRAEVKSYKDKSASQSERLKNLILGRSGSSRGDNEKKDTSILEDSSPNKEEIDTAYLRDDLNFL